ncbi:ATPase, T2SS/T4P/T4SS family [Paracoccus versutus]|uniref:ATPase, T2SS/T4P/T4SS family n=1 Tax=Paracoccus versutus TaxID=34007 RepID=UPI0023EA5A01|nr:ATPase, T2SS/T4P/T4SS family [Paracoccus versutus]
MRRAQSGRHADQGRRRDLSDLVPSSPRLRPDRIRSVRCAAPRALDLLKAWGTGHPGGIGTIHAGSGIGALRRLEQLIQEAVVTVPRAMIAETIDLVAVLARSRLRASAGRTRPRRRTGAGRQLPISPAFSEPDTIH